MIGGWTDDRVKRLKELWADGFSASRIAADLGDLSRNAVIGKAHRIGLSKRPLRTSARAARPRAQRTRGVSQAFKQKQKNGFRFGGPAAELKSPSLPPPPAPVVVEPVTIINLSGRICHWPLGGWLDRAEFFCGDVAAFEGCPYCAAHAAVAYHAGASSARPPPFIGRKGV